MAKSNREKIEQKFRKKAESLGHTVKEYSGRCMYGRQCPSVVVENAEDFIAEMGMKGLRVDAMGLRSVVYTG